MAPGRGRHRALLAVSIPAEPIALAEDPAAFRADWQGAEAWADVAVHRDSTRAAPCWATPPRPSGSDRAATPR